MRKKWIFIKSDQTLYTQNLISQNETGISQSAGSPRVTIL